MMGKKGMRESVRVLMVFVCLFWVSGAQAEEQYLDGIMAVVEESIILESDLARETYAVMQNMPDDNRLPELLFASKF